jgi:hypothetical protein
MNGNRHFGDAFKGSRLACLPFVLFLSMYFTLQGESSSCEPQAVEQAEVVLLP